MKRIAILIAFLLVSVSAMAEEQKVIKYEQTSNIDVGSSTRINSFEFNVAEITPDLISFLKSKIAGQTPTGKTSVYINDCSCSWERQCEDSIILRVIEPITITITPNKETAK